MKLQLVEIDSNFGVFIYDSIKKAPVISTHLGLLEDEKIISCNIQIECINDKNETCLKLSVYCKYEIDENDWDNCIDFDKNEITFNKDILRTIFRLSIGPARGILHAKTKDTIFNNAFISLFDYVKIIDKDISFLLNKNNK